MVNKSILKRTGQRPDYHENNLETATSESTISVLLFRSLGLLIGIFGRVLNWLNGTGSSQIDIHRIKTRNDQYLGLRKWNL